MQKRVKINFLHYIDKHDEYQKPKRFFIRLYVYSFFSFFANKLKKTMKHSKDQTIQNIFLIILF